MLLIRVLASGRVTIAALVLLAVATATGTVVEAAFGRQFAVWYVYGASWFLALLGLVGLNLAAGILIRFPWPVSAWCSVALRAGMLMLVVGAAVTVVYGIEGQVVLRKGHDAENMSVKSLCRLTVMRPSQRGQRSTQITFAPGPVDWPEGRLIDFGVKDGFGVRVVKYLRYSRDRIEWVRDDANFIGPALQLAMTGNGNGPVGEEWLTSSAFGGEATVGPTRFELLPIPVETMLADFLKTPENLGASGSLSVHFDGRVETLRVEDCLGKKIAIGSSGAAVEIAEYLANARPTADGRFRSLGDKPKNPMLELKVFLPDQNEPVRQIAFARLPLMSLDGVRGYDLPVKFVYHHAGVAHTPGARFLQSPDGKLYCRTVVDGALSDAREVTMGDRIAIGDGYEISIRNYLPRARQEISCEPSPIAERECNAAGAAALVELTLGGQLRRLWLKQDDEQFGYRHFATPQGVVTVTLECEQRPLGFRICLKSLDRKTDTNVATENAGKPDKGSSPRNAREAGGAGSSDAGIVSLVDITDSTHPNPAGYRIATGQPISYGKFRICQEGCEEVQGHASASVLKVAQDPGLMIKYAGCIVLLAGLVGSMLLRLPHFRPRRDAAGQNVSECTVPSIHPIDPSSVKIRRAA
jgi:hypothetical protein